MTAPDDGTSRFRLPHGDRARLVTRVIEHDAGAIRCEGRIPRGSPYGRGGRCPPFVLIEFAAQAAASLESLERRDASAAGSPVGLLVRAWNVRIHRRAIAEGQPFRASVRRAQSARSLIVYETSVVDGAGREVLSGGFGIYGGGA